MGVNTPFHDRLRELREEEGISQTLLAKRLGVSRGSLNFYETGERLPDISFLERAAEYFHVCTDYLLGNEDQKNPLELDIQKRLQLSNSAIRFILEREFDHNALSRLISAPLFEELIYRLSAYLELIDHGKITQNHDYCENQIQDVGYHRFLLTQYFIEVLTSLQWYRDDHTIETEGE